MTLIGRRLFVFLAAAALAACGGAKPGADPVGTVTALYEPYVAKRNPPGVLDSAPWTAEIREALDRAMAVSGESNEPTPVLDFDPIVDGQDWEITELAVALKQEPADGAAIVAVVFKNFGEPIALEFDMKEEGGGWRVDNIRTEAWTLRQLLAESGAPAEMGAAE